jgi:hypothetical protein
MEAEMDDIEFDRELAAVKHDLAEWRTAAEHYSAVVAANRKAAHREAIRDAIMSAALVVIGIVSATLIVYSLRVMGIL